jgi:hypothetical protein
MSDEVAFSATRIFELKGASQIQVSIRIGNMDPGGSTVYHNGIFIHQAAGDLVQYPVPTQPGSLKNTILTTVTSVRDTNTQTNRTVIHYVVQSGTATFQEDFEIDVPNQGGRAIYTITLALI